MDVRLIEEEVVHVLQMRKKEREGSTISIIVEFKCQCDKWGVEESFKFTGDE